MVTCQNCGNPFPTGLFPELSRDDFQIRKYPHYVIENKRYSETCPKCKKVFEFFIDALFWKELQSKD
jgi:hypothetical protein